MKVGDLVRLKRSASTIVGLVANVRDCPRDYRRDTQWYTVRWANGKVSDTYEADELEVISESR